MSANLSQIAREIFEIFRPRELQFSLEILHRKYIIIEYSLLSKSSLFGRKMLEKNRFLSA